MWKKHKPPKCSQLHHYLGKKTANGDGLLFHACIRMACGTCCANLFSCLSPPPPKKPKKQRKRRLIGLQVAVDSKLIITSALKNLHPPHWRKPCSAIICLLAESNLQIYSLFYILNEYLLSDEFTQTRTIICWKGGGNGVEVACYLSTALPAGNMPSIVCSVRETKAEEAA